MAEFDDAGIFSGVDDGTMMSRQEERRYNDEVNAETATVPVTDQPALLMQVDERGGRMVMKVVNGRPTENWRRPTAAEEAFLAQSQATIVRGDFQGVGEVAVGETEEKKKPLIPP